MSDCLQTLKESQKMMVFSRSLLRTLSCCALSPVVSDASIRNNHLLDQNFRVKGGLGKLRLHFRQSFLLARRQSYRTIEQRRWSGKRVGEHTENLTGEAREVYFEQLPALVSMVFITVFFRIASRYNNFPHYTPEIQPYLTYTGIYALGNSSTDPSASWLLDRALNT